MDTNTLIFPRPQSIANNRFPVGNPLNFRNFAKGKYDCVVYQGDNGDMQFMDSTTILAGAWLPTGSIAYVDNNVAKASVVADTAVKVAVPYIVKVGTEHPNVYSEKYNAAGGLITLLPLTGYFRLVTTVFEQGESITYAAGDLLTVKQFIYDGRTVLGVAKATSGIGSETIVGIVDGPVGNEVKQNPALAFTAFYRPAVAAAPASSESL